MISFYILSDVAGVGALLACVCTIGAQASMAEIIRHKNTQSGVPESIKDIDLRVPLVKQYTVPNTKDSSQDKDETVTLKFLTSQVKQLKSRNARLEMEIESAIKMLTAALNGEQETYDQVKRRISRLKGALEYPGHE